MGYDLESQDFEVHIIDIEGDDSYDATGVKTHIEIYDGDGNDDYFTTGGNDWNIELREPGSGTNDYDLPHVGRVKLDLDLWEEGLGLSAASVVVNKQDLDTHAVTIDDPIKV